MDNAMVTIGRLADAIGLEAKILRYYDRLPARRSAARMPFDVFCTTEVRAGRTRLTAEVVQGGEP